MTETMPERIWARDDNPLSEKTWRANENFPGQEYVRADLARPAPAEGAVRVKPLEWSSDQPQGRCRTRPSGKQEIWAGFGYTITLGDLFLVRWMDQPISGHPTMREAKDAAQSDCERRILSALASPEDATPAVPVSVEEAGREAVEVAEWAIDVLAICEDPDWRDDEDRMEAMRSAYLESRVSQKHTLQRAKEAIAQQDRRAAEEGSGE